MQSRSLQKYSNLYVTIILLQDIFLQTEQAKMRKETKLPLEEARTEVHYI